MQAENVKTVTRVRNGESQAEIDRETARLNSQGIAVMYFSSQASLTDWEHRLKALSQ